MKIDLTRRLRAHAPKLTRYVGGLLTLGAAWGVQLATFVLTARLLGPEILGAVTALAAPLAILIEVVGLGAGDRFVRGMSRDPSRHGELFGHSLVALLITAPVALVLYLLLVTVVYGLASVPVAALTLGVAELFFNRMNSWAELIAIGHSDYRKANIARLAPPTFRLLGLAVGLGLFDVRSLDGYVFLYSALVVMTSVAQTAWLARCYGPPSASLQPRELAGGVPLALNQVFRAAQGNLDRMALTLVATSETLAFYATSARLLQLGLFPVMAVLRISYHRFFEVGRHGVPATFALSKRLFLPVACLASMAAGSIYISADLIPLLLGSKFAGSVELARYLAPLLLPISLSYIAADALTGADLQNVRVIIFGLSVLLQIVLLAVAAPVWGVWGAVAALYISAVVYAVSLWSTLARLSRRP